MAEGTQLGRYEVVYRLASGGMGSVYLARVSGLAGFARFVALKVLHPNLAHEEEFVSMFLDEARLAAHIRHTNVVATLDIERYGESGYYLAMEVIEGDHLGAIANRAARSATPIPLPIVLRIVLDALAGLEAAHEWQDPNGVRLAIVHRDVSPHNVLVGVDGVSRLTDFGVAKAEVRLTSTRDGKIKGKLGYMAPEQVVDGVSNVRSDLFSLGVLFWETLTATRLFRGESNASVMHALLHTPIAAPSSLRPDAGCFDAVVIRALDRQAAARPASAREFAAEIELAAHGHVVPASAREVGEYVTRVCADRLEPIRRAMAAPCAGQPMGDSYDPDRTPPSIPSRLLRRRVDPAVPPRPAEESDAATRIERPSRTSADAVPEPSAVARNKRTGLRLVGWICLAALSAVLAATMVRLYVAPRAPRSGGAASTPASRATNTQNSGTAAIDPLRADGEPVFVSGDAPFTPDSSSAFAPTIVCRVLVDSTGHVCDARVYGSRPDLAAMESIALAVVRTYRFRPARRAGVPLEAWVNQPVTFQRTPTATHVVRMRGSDTIGAALGLDLARRFRTTEPTVRIDVEALGSATAFAGLFDGSAEIGASSRSINVVERERASQLGLVLREYVIAYDGIAIVVHASNRVRSLTIEQLGAIYSGSLRDWSGVGGSPGPIHLFGRPSYSGTHAFFRDRVLRHGDEHNTAAFASDVVAVEHNDDIARRVAGDPGAIGYVPAGFAHGGVRVVPVASDGSSAPMLPDAATIQDGTYPIYRPLLLYTREQPSRSAILFLRFALSPAARESVAANGFVPNDAPTDIPVPANDGDDVSRPETVRILFGAQSAVLGVEARRSLDAVAQRLRAGVTHASVIGNADLDGPDPRVAAARAHAVADYLRRANVPPDSVEVSSAGADQPVATNDTAVGRRLNRRADVILQRRAPGAGGRTGTDGRHGEGRTGGSAHPRR